MYTLIPLKKYQKQLKKSLRSGHHDIKKLRNLTQMLREEIPLPEMCRDHKLLGKYIGQRECHVEPDWLLIYKVYEEEKIIELCEIGTHSEFFH